MKKLFRIASIFLFLASFLGCDIESKPSQDYGSIQGKAFYSNENVSDHSGIQISLISTDGLRAVDYCEARGIATNARNVQSVTMTDSNGEYIFENVLEGVYTIYASSDSSTKKAITTNVVVKARDVVTPEDLGLIGTGSITGKITIDGKTDDVLGLDVFIAGTSFIAKVDSDGKYEISNVPAKKGYMLCVQKGEKTLTIAESVEVKVDEAINIDENDFSLDDWEQDAFKWLGAFEIAPENPKLYWAYFSTKDGCSYIWNGTNWDLLSQSGSDNSKFITCTAVEEGIKFDVYFMKEIINESNNSHIIIQDINNSISMRKAVSSVPNDNWSPFSLIFPLVESGKEYTFDVLVQNGSINLAYKRITITAIGGMGEYKVENVDELAVSLSDDKVLSVTPQEFTDNPNVPILDYGIKYGLNSNEKVESSVWNGIWLYELNTAWKSSIGLDFDIKKVWEISGWRDYRYLESALKGRWLGVRTVTTIKIAGYTYNDTVEFELNDTKETFFKWDNEEPSKVFVVYGYDLNYYDLGDFIYIFDDVPGVEKYYVLKNGEDMSFVQKGTRNAIEVYGQFIEIGKTIEVPVYIPDFSESEIDLSCYKFTGEWYINDRVGILPYPVVDIVTSGRSLSEIDGYRCIFVMPEIEQVKTIANFYDEDGETLIDSIECIRNLYGSFTLTLPSAPIKDGFVGYWVNEYGSSFTGNSVVDVSSRENNFYLEYRERVFQVDDLYYLNSSVMNLSFNVEAGKQYKIIWADSYEGSSTLSELINENNFYNQAVDINVTAYDAVGNYFTNRDSGFNSPYIFYPNNSGKLYIDVRPYSSGQGYFALAVKEISDSEKESYLIFDPATYSGVTEIIDGELYAKVVVDGYDNYIILPTVLKDLSITKIKGKIKVEKGDAAAIQWAVQFNDAEKLGQAASFNGNTFDEVKEFESNWGPDYSYTDYNNGGVTAYGVNCCESIQVYAQDSSYSAVKGAIIYVGKIIGE